MTDQRRELFQDLETSILTVPGDTSSSSRSTLAQQAGQIYQSEALDEGSIQPEIENYVKKVALHAYRVTDEDVEQLHACGYSDDAIFEITLSVALGVSRKCLTQGLKALDGVRYAAEKH